MEDGDMEDNKMVSVQYECETDISLELDCEALAKKVAQSVLELENCPYDSQVNLVLTDNSGIHEVNRQFRGIDAPTDVLSFPMINCTSSIRSTSILRYFSRKRLIAVLFPFLIASISSLVNVSDETYSTFIPG